MDAVVAGRYRLLERIAVSEMSEVWEADDLELERRVALKLLGRGADPDRFEREAQAAAGLSHPNICRLFDFGETDGRPYIVFELLAGGSLEDRLPAGRPLPDAEAARVAGELAAALGYAHSQGVVHRDVKPANVLFDEDGTAKLADFGVARVTDAATLTEAGTVLGTALYLSPEQALGEPVGPPTDVYAFGVILYRMLTGYPPFEGDSALDVARMHTSQEPQPILARRPDAPPELPQPAMWSLAKRPEDRPPNGNALLTELTSELEEQTQVIAPTRRRVGPRHAAAGAGLAALALVGAGIAVLATPESSQAPVTTSTRDRSTPGLSTSTAGTESAPSTATTATATTAGTTTAGTTAPAEPAPPPPPSLTTPTTPATTETIPTDTTATITDTTPTDTTTTVGETTP